MINRVLDSIRVEGDEGLAVNIANTLVVETTPGHPDGLVTFATEAEHGFKVGAQIYIEGTTNYNGLHEIVAVPGVSTFTVKAKFVVELPDGSGAETVKVAIVPGARFVFVGFSLKMSTAPSTSESLTITLDADDGSNFDVLIYTRNFSTLSDTDVIWTVPEDELIPFEKDDILRIAWTNTDNRTYGLKLWFRRLQ